MLSYINGSNHKRSRYLLALTVGVIALALAIGFPGRPVAAQADDVTNDKAALTAIYHATGGENWTNHAGWLSEQPLREWHGVWTDEAGRVTTLSLYQNNLTGSIPPEIGQLTHLEVLTLSSNTLEGSIPAELGELANLQFLGMSRNNLTGTLPVTMGGMSKLYVADLQHNALTGALPASFGKLAQLSRLYLNDNQLEGTIPESMGDIPYVRLIRLSNNPGIAGSCIPAALQSIVVYTEANLPICPTDNPPMGPDHAALMALYNATDGPNWKTNTNWGTTAPLHRWHGVLLNDAGRVSSLQLGANRLSGSLPPELKNLTQINTLALAENELTGPIPPEIGEMSSLKWLILSQNQLSGAIPGAALANLSDLWQAELSMNALTGPIPAALGDSNVVWLNLASNALTGAVPAELANNDQLSYLGLAGNPGLTGCIPRAITRLRYMVNGTITRNAGLGICTE